MKLLSLIISALLLLSISGERIVKGVQRAKIIGGQPAPVGRYRFQAGLKFSAGATFPGCGGTLIAPNIVLSAGHCSGAVRVTVGCHTLTNATGEPTCETFSIAQEIVHPNFFEDSRGVPHNDLMILKLSGTSVNPPIAYVANPGFDVPEGYDITTMGWGTTSSGSQSAVLLEVDVDTVTNAYCLQQYNELGSGLVDDSMICGERAGKDSCQGDSGGPLIARCDIFEEDILIGAVSWGRGCALPGFAGVYARISFLYSFVLEHVTAAGFSLASPPALSTFCTVNGTFAPTPPPTTAAPVVTPTLPPLPSGWMCSPSYYGSLDGCDCECGVPDPDCETQQDLLFNCPATALGCSPEGICILDDDSSVPSTWTCLTSYYATHDGCDCECGAYDPDCDDVGTIVYNCVAGATCSLEGNCVIASQSPTFSPIASVVITTFPTLSPGDVTLTTFPTASPLVNIATDSPTKFPTTASPTVVLETQAPAEFEQPPLEIEIIYIFVGAALGALIAVAVVCLWFSCSGGSAATARPVKKMEAKEAKISGGVLVNGKGSPTL